MKDGGGTRLRRRHPLHRRGGVNDLNSTITQNSANSQGGGIQFNGSGGNATLTLGAGTIIDDNDSGGDGGGIHINGSARLFALQPYTLIAYNQADNGHGGGIYVAGPAGRTSVRPVTTARQSSTFKRRPTAAASAWTPHPNNANVTVRIFSTDPHSPVQVSNNNASHTGGGVWMHPYISGTSNTDVYPIFCAFDFRIDNNIAQEGSAIYSDTDSGVGNDSGGSVV